MPTDRCKNLVIGGGEAGKYLAWTLAKQGQKTVVVEVVRFKRDNVYKKYVKVRKRYKAHDELGEYRAGDRVEIEEHRPLSREKRWKVVRLLDRPAAELTHSINPGREAGAS